MTTDLALVQKIRRHLRHAWTPFFGRFGRLTDVQMQTIPAILQGHQVVITSATASGKTEAVAAPVAELHAKEAWPGLAVIYLVPTRALGNDMIQRLQQPLADMYLRAVLKHGDQPTLPAGDIHWLITTPESLDSLVCRKPRLLENVRVVIVDEIHLLDGTYRGDQVRILLKRIRQHTQASALTVHLLSATLPDPEIVASRYIDQFKMVSLNNARPIQLYLAKSHEEVKELAIAQKWSKLLYFSNTRKHVEETAAALEAVWRPYPVVVHHGSLDRHRREEAEEVMKRNRVAVCVATSTLEIGIDIGDIDVVVLAMLPWSLEALQQRIGRGGRREPLVSAVALCDSEEEAALIRIMFAAASDGSYQARDYQPDLSVIVQQTFSLLYQYRSGLQRNQLVELFAPLATPTQINTIIDYLIDKGFCRVSANLVGATTELIDLGDEGKIHSNVPDSGDYQVINVESEREIGRIRAPFDDVFLLSGQSWKVLTVTDTQVRVRRHRATGGSAMFGAQRNAGHFDRFLPPEYRKSK